MPTGLDAIALIENFDQCSLDFFLSCVGGRWLVQCQRKSCMSNLECFQGVIIVNDTSQHITLLFKELRASPNNAH